MTNPGFRYASSGLLADNFDMSLEKHRNGWPVEREADPSSDGIKRWKHGDLKDVAYLYVYRLYNDFVRVEAKLNQ